ncbi:MAG: GAF domain-containing protein [Nitrospirota bacterium]
MKPKKSPRQTDPAAILHQRNSQFSTLNQLSAVISQTGSLDTALGGTLDQLLELTGAEIGSVHILEPKTHHLKLIVSRGVSRGFIVADECIPIGDCLCGRVAQTGELISSPDLSTDIRLTRSACRDERFGSVVSIPLKSRERVLGVMTIYAKHPHAFKAMDQEFLVLVGRQIGVAIENAQLYAHIQEIAVLQERGLIAREIHDGIAQNLAYLNLETKKLEDLLKENTPKQALSELNHIRRVIQDTYEDVRELLVDFRAKFKEDQGLIETLSSYIQDFSQRTGIHARLIHTTDRLLLAPTAQVQLFRVVQEALSNVRKHASAKEVTVSLSATPASLEVQIQDDGCGFDPHASPEGNQLRMGLEIMRERIAQIQGRLRLESQPGRGTELRITVPLMAEGRSG